MTIHKMFSEKNQKKNIYLISLLSRAMICHVNTLVTLNFGTDCEAQAKNVAPDQTPHMWSQVRVYISCQYMNKNVVEIGLYKS